MTTFTASNVRFAALGPLLILLACAGEGATTPEASTLRAQTGIVCAESGEMLAGKDVFLPALCCEGLEAVGTAPYRIGCSGAAYCFAACGDGICDEDAGESDCTCSVDCDVIE